jgi:hypothetical protein
MGREGRGGSQDGKKINGAGGKGGVSGWEEDKWGGGGGGSQDGKKINGAGGKWGGSQDGKKINGADGRGVSGMRRR